jgi:hypothetical protein
MFLMYKLFTKNPSKSSLDQIIKNAKNTVCYSTLDIKSNRLNTDVAKDNSQYWLGVKYESTEDYKQTINNNFNEILADIETISKHSCSSEIRDIYLNIITEYDKKIRQVYLL